MNNNLKTSLKRLLAKKRPVSANAISNFFVTINLYKKDNAHQKKWWRF
jgi:hypothetical protein